MLTSLTRIKLVRYGLIAATAAWRRSALCLRTDLDMKTLAHSRLYVPLHEPPPIKTICIVSFVTLVCENNV